MVELNTCILHLNFSEPTPPGQPSLIHVESRGMSFKYNRPDHENGIITHQEIEYTHTPYNVCAADTGTTISFVETEILPVNMSDEQFSFSLIKLKPFWEYSIRVRVNTSAGFSNFSENITIRTQPDSKYPSWNYYKHSPCIFSPNLYKSKEIANP